MSSTELYREYVLQPALAELEKILVRLEELGEDGEEEGGWLLERSFDLVQHSRAFDHVWGYWTDMIVEAFCQAQTT